MTFPFTKNIGAYDDELTPLIEEAISQYIVELAVSQYPHHQLELVVKHYNTNYKGNYEALALLITEKVKNYVKTKSPNPSGGTSQSG